MLYKHNKTERKLIWKSNKGNTTILKVTCRRCNFMHKDFSDMLLCAHMNNTHGQLRLRCCGLISGLAVQSGPPIARDPFVKILIPKQEVSTLYGIPTGVLKYAYGYCQVGTALHRSRPFTLLHNGPQEIWDQAFSEVLQKPCCMISESDTSELASRGPAVILLPK